MYAPREPRGQQKEPARPLQKSPARPPQRPTVGDRRQALPNRWSFADISLFPPARAEAPQAKLNIGVPGDRFEQEADRVADQVTVQRATTGTGPPAEAAPVLGSLVHEDLGHLRGSGQPLPHEVRSSLEPRMGFDFSQVRVHVGERAAASAGSINARAYTVGKDIVFANGQYAPQSPAGQHLLAHELTHVAQQGAAPAHDQAPHTSVQPAPEQVQGGFFDSLWGGIKSAAGAVWSGVKAVGQAVATGAGLVAGAFRDAAMWVANVVRDLPDRLAHLVTTITQGVWGVVSFVPEMIMALVKGGWKGLGDFLVQKALDGGAGIMTLTSRVFDLVGGPELTELLDHILAVGTTALTAEEVANAQSVLGESAVRWNDVQVTEGGLWALIHLINHKRAVTTWHTINMPAGQRQSRPEIVVHELTHVYQYEKAGTRYLGQAVLAQCGAGYDYGGAIGLEKDFKAGKKYRDYNREQQAQIAEDYFVLLKRDAKKEANGDATKEASLTKEYESQKKTYQPFIAQLQAGQL